MPQASHTSIDLGVEIAPARVRVVLVRGAAVLWARTEAWVAVPDVFTLAPADDAALPDTPTLVAVLTGVLEGAAAAAGRHAPPLARFRRRPPVVHAALSPTFVQVKRLSGLPPVADDAVLAGVVRENVGQFFLKAAVPLLTGGVRRVSGRSATEQHAEARVDASSAGASDVDTPTAPRPETTTSETMAWAAAYLSPVVCDVIRACVAARLRLGSVAPTAVVLGNACRGSEVQWTDGATPFAARYVDGVLAALQRLPRSASARQADGDSATPDLAASDWWDPALDGLGPDGGGYAAAFGAARHRGRDPVSLVPRHRSMRYLAAACAPAARPAVGPVPRTRLVLAGVACALGLASAATAPGVAALRAERRAADALHALGPARARAAADEAARARALAVLDALAPFDAGRRSPTVWLAQLARDLPTGAAVVDVRLDSVGGTLVALAPHPGDLVRVVEHLPDVDAAELVGTLTRERDPTEAAPIPVPGAPPGVGPPVAPPPGPAGPAHAPTLADSAKRPSGDLARITVHFRFRAPPRLPASPPPAA
ncbi:hypothetical protein tb265_50080 [Gemmatimonadetes bacterium T265]|nr:hypothetical protein tb265_50080 [Gemmatimonadetes bacterium T265]